MTYKQFIKSLDKIALTQHNIRYAGNGDLYRDLNSDPNIKYGVFYTTPGQTQAEGDFDYYNVNAFIIDRLENMDGDNMLQVQSSAKEVLDNIFTIFCDTYDAEIYGRVYYTMFTQRFSDECAGCFMNITIELPKSTICPED